MGREGWGGRGDKRGWERPSPSQMGMSQGGSDLQVAHSDISSHHKAPHTKVWLSLGPLPSPALPLTTPADITTSTHEVVQCHGILRCGCRLSISFQACGICYLQRGSGVFMCDGVTPTTWKLHLETAIRKGWVGRFWGNNWQRCLYTFFILW